MSVVTRADEPEIPLHIQNLDNLTVIATEEGEKHTVHFEREMEFGSTADPLIGGLGSFAVDEDNRVYLGDTQQQTIHIFDPKGQYTASLGKQGRETGEFQFPGYLKIVDNLLFAFDPRQFRYNAFSTEPFGLHETIPFNVSNKRDFDELSDYELRFTVCSSPKFGCPTDSPQVMDKKFHHEMK